jgi:sarcosine oxidase gamma subunit
VLALCEPVVWTERTRAVLQVFKYGERTSAPNGSLLRAERASGMALIEWVVVEPGSLVGAELVLRMVDRPHVSLLDQSVAIDARGPGEWIVGVASGERSRHVYRLAPGDWLVSEVGRRNEGRAADLKQAIVALSAGGPSPDWWSVVPGALDGSDDRRRLRG